MSWFAFDPDIYDGDTMHLTAMEDGVYMRLLRMYYRNRQPLPDNDKALAAIARIGLSEWLEVAPTIRQFFRLKNGKLHQKRADQELDRDDQLGKMRSEKAKRAANIRHGNQQDECYEHATGIGQACSEDAQAMLEPCSIMLPTPLTPTPKKILFASFWDAYPRKVGKADAERAWVRAIKQARAEDILAGIPRLVLAIKANGTDKKFIPHAATWLNGGRWMDEEAGASADRKPGTLGW